MVCEYCNIVALCRYHLGRKDHTKIYCNGNYSNCEKYKQNEELKKELIKKEGEEKGLTLLVRALNIEARRRDRLDGILK